MTKKACSENTGMTEKTKSDLACAQAALQEGHTCAFCIDGAVTASDERGILPLLRLCDDPPPRGFCAADKIVGKAAAMLYAHLGASAVYADVLSNAGEAVLRAHGVYCACKTKTDAIINRKGDDICPMEKRVADIEDIEEGVKCLFSYVTP